MAIRWADRVAESISAPSGSAAFVVSATSQWQTSVAGLSGGWQTFAHIPSLANGDTFRYCAYDGSGNTEIGVGTWVSASHSITRAPVRSSNSDAACSFSGTVTVFLTVDAFYINAFAASIGAT